MNFIFDYLPYAFIIAYTPGPNNILALNAVSRKGMREGKRTLMGISIGFFLVMTISAIGCLELSQFMPRFAWIMKYIGSAYILWLAFHILIGKSKDQTNVKNNDFWSSFLLQFINVKIILYAITIYTGYILPNTNSKLLLSFSVILNTLIGISGCITWALAGHLLQKQYIKYYRIMNAVMAMVLIWSAFHLIF